MTHSFPTRRSSDLHVGGEQRQPDIGADRKIIGLVVDDEALHAFPDDVDRLADHGEAVGVEGVHLGMEFQAGDAVADVPQRSEEHTSELQSLMRISYAVFCLKKNKS